MKMNTAKVQAVKIEKPDESKLKRLNVMSWPVWEKEPGSFDWHYDERETCYFLEGNVTVTTAEGNFSFGKGDLVTFEKGLSCRWNIKQQVRKHYMFGNI